MILFALWKCLVESANNGVHYKAASEVLNFTLTFSMGGERLVLLGTNLCSIIIYAFHFLLKFKQKWDFIILWLVVRQGHCGFKKDLGKFDEWGTMDCGNMMVVNLPT